MSQFALSAPLLAAIAYVALMFGGAALVHRFQHRLQASVWRMYAYTLALGVYCTSWTYFGAVGSAATGGWSYLPIYLGPILLMALGGRFLFRLNTEVRKDGATSISDFIGSRFGKSRTIAALVTIIVLFGTVPYIALQLRSVALSFALVTGTPESTGPLFGAAGALAAFAIVFGARRYQVSGQNEAILFAVAFESVIKLAALCMVAGLALWLLWTVPDMPEVQMRSGMAILQDRFSWDGLNADFFVTTALSVLAIVCLPRHFFISVMEAAQPGDILRARWGFIAYLLMTLLTVLPIAAAGIALLPPGAAPDLFVIELPQHFGLHGLTLLVFLGGLSAAVAMVVAETVAISSMISNDLFAPMLLQRPMGGVHMGERLLWIRRSAIIMLMAAAVVVALWTPSSTQLAAVGLIAFAAIAQCAPALLLAVYGDNNDEAAAQAGLVVGFLLWFGLLFIPGVSGASVLTEDRWTWLPHFLHVNALTQGVLLSLGGNIAAYLLVAGLKRGKDRFPVRFGQQRAITAISTIGALYELVVRFVGREAADEAFGERALEDRPIDRSSARKAERLIGSVVGASSARAIMHAAVSGEGMGFAEVAQMLDASGQSLHFSQGLLAVTLENIDIGVSVIDRDFRLVAWNSRYLEMFHYPAGVIRVGVPVADLIRFNAEQGNCGPGEVEDHIARRLEHMRSRNQHMFERHRMDGRVIKTVGGPMPDGGYVMSFTDITIEARARAATETARRDLERAVSERTAELTDVNARLAAAMADKTRFLAAASHDLLQPLHAATLFSSALRRQLDEPQLSLLARLDRSIEGANDLLRALLDISKLDAGGITPKPSRFAVRAMLADLADSLQPLAMEKGLSLRVGRHDGWVLTDRSLLLSIVQNFLSNAIRYTEKGGILVTVRPRTDRLVVEVRDSGIGIPPNKLNIIFREFERLGQGNESGIGLGLAIVERSAALIGGKVEVRSRPAVGSCFSITLPLASPGVSPGTAAPVVRNVRVAQRLQLLVVDDDMTNRAAMCAALEAAGHGCTSAAGAEDVARLSASFDGALVDFHLGADLDGITLIREIRVRWPGIRVALVTAERSEAMLERARAEDIPIFAKPLSLAMLDQWLAA